MPLLRPLVYCWLVAWITQTTVANETPLVWKLQTGDQHQYRLTQTMDMEMTLGQAKRQLQTRLQQVLDMTWEVTEIDAQAAALRLSVDRIQIDIIAPGQPEVHYDTASEKAPSGYAAILSPLLKTMTGQPFEACMTTRGEITSFKLPADFEKALKNTPQAGKRSALLSEVGFKNMLQQSSPVLPESKGLKPGHAWTVKIATTKIPLGKLQTETTYNYQGQRQVKETSLEVFSLATVVKPDQQTGKVQLEITEQAATGEVLFDRAAGRIKSSELRQELQLNFTTANQNTVQKMVQTVVFEQMKKP